MQLHNVLGFQPTCRDLLGIVWFLVVTFVDGRIRSFLNRDSNPDAPKGSGF